ncbi:LysE family translocator [Nocardia brasiliensis]|uniref:LysE family translocator n=1 Tax=Nocardia brasiliensis TaxID=37326 RepID=A0A6G9XSC6_NOCBR|nr:LysE family translocator [Nocardia brasiliensis]QIS03861.1 LysE family translocator [Nocardia brasiliensis]
MSVGTAVVSFAVVAGLLTLVPGLDTALVLRAAVVRGTRGAFATAAGVGTGLLVWGAAATAGVSVLLTTSQVAYTVLRVAGALYLIWLGLTSLRTAWRRDGAVGWEPDADPGGGLVRAWARGALSNLLNPKVGVFYLAMLPQFLPPHAPHLLMGLSLTMIHIIEGLVWWTVLICVVRAARAWLSRVSVKRAMEAVTGSVLLALGVKLAFDAP